MKYSKFGDKFAQEAGILSLMKDMGEALAAGGDDLIMMGGGNPGYIPEFQRMMQQRLHQMALDEHTCTRLMGQYCSPQGDAEFLTNVARLLHNEYGWKVGPENICLTNGSQSGFFLLLNMFAGDCNDGVQRKIRLPLAPEYIGYADIGLDENFFISTRPHIDRLDENIFKYRVDFSGITIGDETGAICVSRPTNPTGNVVTDSELERLDQLARAAGVPLIIDNAYGVPFPGIVYTQATSLWNENIILCLSLSKLGLPAVRTGIIVAQEEVIRILSGMNAVMALAPAGFGAFLANELVKTTEIIRLSKEIIRPFYQRKAERAVKLMNRELVGTPYKIHKPEGAMFIWLWLEDLPISCKELYERLKRRGVLIISGHYFFPGLEADEWRHKEECIRVTYSQDDAQVEKGIAIIGDEVRKAYQEGG